jgi:hypothetical protein
MIIYTCYIILGVDTTVAHQLLNRLKKEGFILKSQNPGRGRRISYSFNEENTIAKTAFNKYMSQDAFEKILNADMPSNPKSSLVFDKRSVDCMMDTNDQHVVVEERRGRDMSRTTSALKKRKVSVARKVIAVNVH